MSEWVVQPALWEAIKQKMARELPIGSRVFWKRVLLAYLKRGGKLLVVQPMLEEDNEVHA